MKRILLLCVAIVVLSSHDMFFKMDSFFLEPDTPVSLKLYNGTFDRSDNVITRDRMIDVSLVGNGNRTVIDTNQWKEVGKTTILEFQSGASGTWVAGLSTKARNIELSASDFNDYLDHDGVLDVLSQRKEDGTINEPAVEKYSKHVKAVFQVGNIMSEDWNTDLGYPIEFILQNNPYELSIGDHLEVLLLRDGQPLANQLVYSGFAGGGHTHDDEEDSEAHHHDEHQMRTDASGKLKVKLDHGGQWYIRTIHMVDSDEPGLTHESNWATLTFEVAGSGHGHGPISTLVYWISGLFVIMGLFIFFFRRRK